MLSYISVLLFLFQLFRLIFHYVEYKRQTWLGFQSNAMSEWLFRRSCTSYSSPFITSSYSKSSNFTINYGFTSHKIVSNYLGTIICVIDIVCLKVWFSHLLIVLLFIIHCSRQRRDRVSFLTSTLLLLSGSPLKP